MATSRRGPAPQARDLGQHRQGTGASLALDPCMEFMGSLLPSPHPAKVQGGDAH